MLTNCQTIAIKYLKQQMVEKTTYYFLLNAVTIVLDYTIMSSAG